MYASQISVRIESSLCNKKYWDFSQSCFNNFEDATLGYLEFDCMNAYINKTGFPEGWAEGLKLQIVQHGLQPSKNIIPYSKNWFKQKRGNAAVRVGITEVEVFGKVDTSASRCGCNNGLGYTYAEEPGCDPAKTLNASPLSESCKLCDPGYTFGMRETSGNYDFQRCQQNICTCANGQAATGTDCHTHLMELCTGCDQDYHLMKNECKDSLVPCTNRMYDAVKGVTGDMLHIRYDAIQPNLLSGDPSQEIRLHYHTDWASKYSSEYPNIQSKWIEMSDTTISQYTVEFVEAGNDVTVGWIPHNDAFWKCHATWQSDNILGKAYPRQIPGQCQDNEVLVKSIG